VSRAGSDSAPRPPVFLVHLGATMIMRESTLVELPPRLSDAIDQAVLLFEQQAAERIESYRRWHGADLWMVFAESNLDDGTVGVATRRVTVGAFSDTPDDLRFIPDIVVQRRGGRYMLPAGQEGAQDMVGRISIFYLLEELHRSTVTAQKPWAVVNQLHQALADAWLTAKKIHTEYATALLP
jgi:hypothetical protein